MRGSPESFELAKAAREKLLADTTELLNACECEYPIVRLRNMHCHGDTKDGEPCPAIEIWRRQGQERDRTKALAGVR